MHKQASITGADLPIELQLLAACCDHPVTDATEARVERFAKEIRNWKDFHRAIYRHQLQGFAQDRLGQSPLVPDDLRERWSAEAKQRAFLNLGQARATGELHVLLRDNAIPNVVLKGLPLAIALYSSLTIKRSSDIDLLVSEGNVWKTVQLLAERGYRPHGADEPLTERQTLAVVRHYKEITLSNADGIVIDLHWRLVESPALLTGIEPFRNARSVGIENVGEIAVLSEEDEFAYLCVHGALSDWSRLKWLCDVNAMIGDTSDARLLELYNYAEQLGAGPSVLQALGLRALVWSKPLPDKLATKLEALGGDELLHFPLKRMTEPYKPASFTDAARRIADQARIRGTLYQDRTRAALELRSHLHALPDMLAVPLPRGLDWLYVPLRPIMWIARKIRA